MMVDPRTQTQSTHRWEVLKANKIYPIATDDLLVRLWQENRLSISTKIRRNGEQEWRDHDSINWSTFIAMVTESSAPPSSEDTEVEAAETAEVSITEESLRAEAALEKGSSSIVVPAEPKAKDEVPTWWHDEAPPRSQARTRRSLVLLYAIATVALTACLVAVAILSSRLLQPNSTTTAPTAGVPSTQALPAADQAEPLVEAHNDPAVSSEVPGPATSNDMASAESAVQTEKQLQSEMVKPNAVEAQALAVKDSASLSQPPPAVAAAPAVMAEPADRKVQDLLERLESSLEVYRDTRKELSKCREEIKKSDAEWQPALAKKNLISARMESLNIAILDANKQMLSWELFISNRGGMAGNTSEVQQARAQWSALNVMRQQAEAEGAQLAVNLVNINAQGEKHLRLIAEIGERVKEIATSEVASLDRYMELMDFFGEKPLDYHRQVYEKTSRILDQEPDFFYALALNSAAAIQLGKYDAPRNNWGRMNKHVQSISPDERRLRAAAISHFGALALGLAGLNDYRDGRRESSLKQSDQAVKYAPQFLELRLLRGMIGTELRGIKDGEEHFLQAVKIAPNDPRIYRVRLDSLLPSRSPPTQLLSKLLENLLKVALEDDEPSWLTAAETCIALNRPDEAQQYLTKVHSPIFEDRKQKLLAKLK